MKKNFKKLSAILMAIVMVLAMSTSVFAATGEKAAGNVITATVEFIDENGSVYEVTNVEIDKDTFVRNQYTTDGHPGTDIIRDNTPTVMDATLIALTNLGKNNDVVSGWDTVDPRGGMYITKMLGLQTETAADTSTTVWRGYSWKYQIEYADADVYASNMALVDGMTISWWYGYREEPIK